MSSILFYFAALMMAHKFKKKLNWTAPLTILLLSLILYLFGLLDLLLVGAYAECIFIVFAIVYSIYYILKKDKDIIALMKSPASVTLIIAAIFFTYFSLNRGLSEANDVDSLRVWALQVKNMCYYDVLYSPSFTSEGNYSPGTMLWNYLACKSWIGYSEGIMFLAQSMFTVSLLLPLYDCIENYPYKKKASVIVFFLIFLIPASFRADVYGSLYVDVILSELTFYGAISVYRLFREGGRFDILNITCTLFVLTFAKRIGITNASAVIFTCALCMSYLDPADGNRIGTGKKIALLSLFTLAPVIFYWSWAVVTTGFENSLSSPMLLPFVGGIGGWLIGAVLKKTRKYLNHTTAAIVGVLVLIALIQIGKQYFLKDDDTSQITISFVENIFLTERCYYGQTLPLSVGAFTIIVLSIWYLIHHFYRNQISRLAKTLTGSIFVGMIGYLVVLLFTYVGIISLYFDSETKYLPSFDRYMMPWMFVLLGMTIVVLLSTAGREHWIIYPMCLVAILLSLNISDFADYMLEKPSLIEFYAFEQADVELTADDVVYFIDETDSQGELQAFNYSLLPAKAYKDEPSLSYKEALVDSDDQTSYPSLSEVRSEIAECDYVYIQMIDDEFVDRYKDLFEDPSEIDTGAVYNVIHENGTVMLEKIE